MPLASRMDRMGTEATFRVRARARALEAEGRDVIHLEMGEPDLPTPPHVVEAAVRALRDGHTGYAPVAGLPALREAIAEDVTVRRGLETTADRVVVCPGAKPVIFFTFLALVEPGDEVVLPDPGFPIFRSMADALGARCRTYHPGSGTATRPDLDAIRDAVSDRTRLLVLNSPGNPTGVVHRPEELEAMAALCRTHDVLVLSDEIYARILYGVEHRSIASLEGMAERTIVLDGFSKTYCMTGWRLGYAVLPPKLVDGYERLLINSVSCAVHFAQHGALAALQGPQDGVARMVDLFRGRRDALLGALGGADGVRVDAPEGAFFAFADVRGTGHDETALADALLEDAGVAVVEGTAFGPAGRGHLRFSFTADEARIREAGRRIRNHLGA